MEKILPICLTNVLLGIDQGLSRLIYFLGLSSSYFLITLVKAKEIVFDPLGQWLFNVINTSQIVWSDVLPGIATLISAVALILGCGLFVQARLQTRRMRQLQDAVNNATTLVSAPISNVPVTDTPQGGQPLLYGRLHSSLSALRSRGQISLDMFTSKQPQDAIYAQVFFVTAVQWALDVRAVLEAWDQSTKANLFWAGGIASMTQSTKIAERNQAISDWFTDHLERIENIMSEVAGH